MSEPMRIMMVAAENDDLPGAKIGGVADVLRDLPKALIKKQTSVDCVIPSYGKLARLPGLEQVGVCQVRFADSVEEVLVLRRVGKRKQADVYILHSPLLFPQGEKVYCHDPKDRPFSTDATKFAFFSAAVAQALLDDLVPRPDVLHCHDWHTAFLLILLHYDQELSGLKTIKTVYSIHNLAMQGVRPMRDDASAFATWFPWVSVDSRKVADPILSHCVNPMRAGILLADKVHTVSPTYASEILSESRPDIGLYGGEGLEKDLQHRSEEGDLVGILNGCEYPRASAKSKAKLGKNAVAKLVENSIEVSAASSTELLTAHWLADRRAKQWINKKKPGMLLTSVGRITSQKAQLFVTEVSSGVTALSSMLDALGSKGTFILLGSGDKDLEQALVKESAKHDNFIFINGFSPALATALYQIGDLFIMPSSFEPCGISQLLAMREGQACLVNRVGGLRDTVEPNKNGFAFEGLDSVEQAKAMVDTFKEALRVYTTSEDIWLGISKAAAKVRFTWDDSVNRYLAELYDA